MRSIHLISDDERENQKNRKFLASVSFSIITPLYNTPENYLRELLESLQNRPIQTGSYAWQTEVTLSMNT